MKKFLKFGFIFCLIMAVFLCLLIITLFINMKYMENLSKNYRYYDRGIEIVPEADYIVVPGAKVKSYAPSTHLQHRLDYAYQLYIKNKASKIIVSGGYDEEEVCHETNIMYNYLIKMGIPEKDIIRDLQGNSTYETLKRVKDYVGDKSIIFCTQELYSHRAVYIAKKLDLNINIYCSNPVIYVHVGRNTIRESLAQVKAIIDCNFFTPNVFALDTSPFISIKEEN